MATELPSFEMVVGGRSIERRLNANYSKPIQSFMFSALSSLIDKTRISAKFWLVIDRITKIINKNKSNLELEHKVEQ